MANLFKNKILKFRQLVTVCQNRDQDLGKDYTTFRMLPPQQSFCSNDLICINVILRLEINCKLFIFQAAAYFSRQGIITGCSFQIIDHEETAAAFTKNFFIELGNGFNQCVFQGIFKVKNIQIAAKLDADITNTLYFAFHHIS